MWKSTSELGCHAIYRTTRGRLLISTRPGLHGRPGPVAYLLFCLVLLPVRAAYLRRSGSKQPPSVGICSAAWGYGFVAGAAWFCGAVLVFVAGEDIGVTVALAVRRGAMFADRRGIMGLILLGRGRARVAAGPRLHRRHGRRCLYGAAIVLIARSAA